MLQAPFFLIFDFEGLALEGWHKTARNVTKPQERLTFHQIGGRIFSGFSI